MIVLKIEDYFLNLTFKSNYIDIIDNISILLGTHRYIENINLSNPNEMELFIDKNPDGGYSLQFNNKEETCKDLCDLMGTLLCILYEKLPTEKFFYLHGGGVSKENICIALLAPSNGGKTTIVMGLLESGFNYRSDDIIPICKTDAKSFSFPKPIFFRDNSPYSQYSNLIIKNYLLFSC